MKNQKALQKEAVLATKKALLLQKKWESAQTPTKTAAKESRRSRRR
jgi:hypothetical protein